MSTTTSPIESLILGGLGQAGAQPFPGVQHAKPPLTQPPQTQPQPAAEQLLKLADNRKVIGATGVPFADKYSKAGAYSPEFMSHIVKAANHVGVDPNLALAIALQEGRMKKDDVASAIVSSRNVGEKPPEGLDDDAYQLAKIIKSKMTEGKNLGFHDEARQIQMFNGMGKIFPRSNVGHESYYGIPVSKENPLDMRKNPVYGRTIQDLRDNVIMKSPELQKLIASAK